MKKKNLAIILVSVLILGGLTFYLGSSTDLFKGFLRFRAPSKISRIPTKSDYISNEDSKVDISASEEETQQEITNPGPVDIAIDDFQNEEPNSEEISLDIPAPNRSNKSIPQEPPDEKPSQEDDIATIIPPDSSKIIIPEMPPLETAACPAEPSDSICLDNLYYTCTSDNYGLVTSNKDFICSRNVTLQAPRWQQCRVGGEVADAKSSESWLCSKDQTWESCPGTSATKTQYRIESELYDQACYQNGFHECIPGMQGKTLGQVFGDDTLEYSRYLCYDELWVSCKDFLAENQGDAIIWKADQGESYLCDPRDNAQWHICNQNTEGSKVTSFSMSENSNIEYSCEDGKWVSN